MARAWADLSESERKRVDEEILVIRNDLTDLIKQMRDRAGAAIGLAEVIEQALERPGSRDSVYLVGDQPVSVFWGFQDEQIRPVAAAGDIKAGLPRWPIKQAAAPDPVAPDVVIAPVAPAPAEAPREGRWRWLLWLLLGLMLLALLFYLLRGCDQAPRASPEQTAPPLAAQEPIRPDSPLDPLSRSSPNVSVPDPDLPPLGPDGGTRRLGPLTSDVAPRLLDRMPGGGVEVPSPSPIALAPDSPLPAKPKPGDHIQIPLEAAKQNAIEFLEGKWLLGDRLTNSLFGQDGRRSDEQLVRVELEFDRSGRGTRTTVFLNHSGGRCEGSAMALMSAGRLSIQMPTAPCAGVPRRLAISAQNVLCEASGSQTLCSWTNSNGQKVSNVPLIRR
jgi:hypothetical protein